MSWNFFFEQRLFVVKFVIFSFLDSWVGGGSKVEFYITELRKYWDLTALRGPYCC